MVTRLGDAGAPELLLALSAGQYFGETCLVATRQPRSATVTATETCLLFCLQVLLRERDCVSRAV